MAVKVQSLYKEEMFDRASGAFLVSVAFISKSYSADPGCFIFFHDTYCPGLSLSKISFIMCDQLMPRLTKKAPALR